MKNFTLSAATIGVAIVNLAWAAPAAQDRVYTGDQNSNTVSVIDPATNLLLGQIKLGNQRPDVLSPLYKGELNVHGLGFSPDHKTLIAISNGSNSVTFIDTATNKVKGVAYIGRSPHEGFFTADGKEVWVVVRGENYISAIDSLEVSLFKLKPQTVYSVYVSGQKTPVASLKTNPMGMANGTTIGPSREVANMLSAQDAVPSKIIVMEGDAPADSGKAVLVSTL